MIFDYGFVLWLIFNFAMLYLVYWFFFNKETQNQNGTIIFNFDNGSTSIWKSESIGEKLIANTIDALSKRGTYLTVLYTDANQNEQIRIFTKYAFDNTNVLRTRELATGLCRQIKLSNIIAIEWVN